MDQEAISQSMETLIPLITRYGMQVLGAIVILVVGKIISSILGKVVRKAMTRAKADPALIGFVSAGVSIAIMIFAIIAALAKFGIQTTSFIAVLGAAGFAIGMAMQGSLGNFASGVLILIFRPIRIGDLVETGGYLGKIVDIGIFVTTMNTLDNQKIIIPNGVITGNVINNVNGNETRRVDMTAGISYSDDMTKAGKILEGILAEHPKVLADPAPTVAVKELGDSSVNFVVRPWVKAEDYWTVWFEVTQRTKEEFDKQGISIPFPQRDVHLFQETQGFLLSSREVKVHRGLHTLWERRTIRTAIVLAAGAFVLLALSALVIKPAGMPFWLLLTLSTVPAYGIYVGLTRKVVKRRVILARPFPAEWEEVLQREVVFYRALEPAERERFRSELKVFLGEKRITGIKLELDTTTRVLAAASAIIPIFGFPEWEWDQIDEILVYPSRFDEDFSFGDSRGHDTLGMVGTGYLNRLMILSKPDLLGGFRNPSDKRNVGLHEFAHLVDKSDGTIDGLPGVGLDRQATGPWIELVRRKMEEIRRGKSDINPYALTNEAEFFAVVTEYFFERPGVMQRKHPELYDMLARVFNQNLLARVVALTREIKRGRPRFGRNSPCPCGSGKKYKKCCLKR